MDLVFNINQIIDMKRKRNGAEIKSVRPDDVLFPLFPVQNSIPKSITLLGMKKSLKCEKEERNAYGHSFMNYIRKAKHSLTVSVHLSNIFQTKAHLH